MGASCTKDAGTESDKNKKPQSKKEEPKKMKEDTKKAGGDKGKGEDKNDDTDEPWACREQSIRFIMKELNVSEEVATKIVNKANKDDDDLIEGNELRVLWKQICEARDELKPMFERADTNKTGKVSVGEAARVLKEKWPNMKEGPIKKVAKQFDNGDGIMEYGEFIIFYQYYAAVEKDLGPLFKSADTNNTGLVTLQEARDALAPRFPKLSEDGIRGLLRKYDDGDGAVQYEEFILFFTNLKQARNSLSAKFNKLDTNEDGKLSNYYVIELVCEETKMDEHDSEALVWAADKEKDGFFSKDEFIELWSNFY